MTERKAMIKAKKLLSLTRQCQLLAVPRSSAYVRSQSVSVKDLTLMRLLDELYLKWPFYVSRRLCVELQPRGQTRPTLDVQDGAPGYLPRGGLYSFDRNSSMISETSALYFLQRKGQKMAGRSRPNHSPAFKAKVALAAVRGDRTLAERKEISREIAGGYPSGAWPLNLGGLLQRVGAKLSDMAGAVDIVPRWPMTRLGRPRAAPKPCWLNFTADRR